MSYLGCDLHKYFLAFLLSLFGTVRLQGAGVKKMLFLEVRWGLVKFFVCLALFPGDLTFVMEKILILVQLHFVMTYHGHEWIFLALNHKTLVWFLGIKPIKMCHVTFFPLSLPLSYHKIATPGGSHSLASPCSASGNLQCSYLFSFCQLLLQISIYQLWL